MLKLYVIKDIDSGGILATMPDHSFQISTDLNNPPKDKFVIGVVDPELHGNYWNELLTGGKLHGEFGSGMSQYLDYLVSDAIPNGIAVISEDFPFDPKNLTIVELIENENT